jgi:hypothetical protein
MCLYILYKRINLFLMLERCGENHDFDFVIVLRFMDLYISRKDMSKI